MRKIIKGLSKNNRNLVYILCGITLFSMLSTVYVAKQFTKALNLTTSKFTEVMVSQEPDVLESDLPHEKLGKFKLSWYSPKELGKSHPSELRTSKGKIPTRRTIAVDPKVIPYGSIVYIQDYGYYIAEDCGGAIKGNRIDIFTPSYDEAIRKGRKVANVYLLR